MHPTTYILLTKRSQKFKLYIYEIQISIDLLVYENIQCMFVCCVRLVILRRDWDHVT
jgi:hypothetical protein